MRRPTEDVESIQHPPLTPAGKLLLRAMMQDWTIEWSDPTEWHRRGLMTRAERRRLRKLARRLDDCMYTGLGSNPHGSLLS